ncbi:TetR/AcrR family transcriptional regulator [Microtetraspora malaysiensis]|uniref:TetR/AcrR family transcriptional regulator n=1 Tax=Microtetraspora malaysiensis TaxID=161358 RepID=UPI003D8FD8CF
MSDQPTRPSRPEVGRRRGAELEQAILQAAADVLIESGYTALTMDKVAARAGTNKNAIYRRWPNRAALAVAAYRGLARADVQLPDTGRLRDDALELLRRANSTWSSPYGEILRSLLASVGDDPELRAQINEHANDGGSGIWLTLLGRAVARGEAPPEALHPRVATTAIALLRNEYVTREIPFVPDNVLVEIVDEVYLPLVRGRGSAPA